MIEKVFKAYDVRATYPDMLNEPIGQKIGYGAGKYLLEQASGEGKTVAVGRDMRKSAPSMAAALIEGLRAAGCDVVDLGMVDTPFVYFAINQLGCIGGIQTTASHNPPQYIGFKISREGALPVGMGSGLDEIQAVAAGVDVLPEATGALEEKNLWPEYKEHVLKSLKLSKPLKIVIDASNGMAGKFMPEIFDDVADLDITKINFELTGEFVHEPNPLEPENMKQTQDGVKELSADLGVCFDGDGDRCMVTDELGNIVGCDHLGALMAEHYLKANPGTAIVYDLRSSHALKEHVESLGGKPVRSRVGHVFMKKVLRESAGAFGAELSGHMYYEDNFFTDSGVLTFAIVASILSESDKPLSELIAPLKKYPQSGEINFEVEDKDGAIAALREKYSTANIDDLDGITVDAMEAEGWWLNVRKSNTEPLLRLNLEAKTDELLAAKLEEVKPYLGTVATGH